MAEGSAFVQQSTHDSLQKINSKSLCLPLRNPQELILSGGDFQFKNVWWNYNCVETCHCPVQSRVFEKSEEQVGSSSL